MATTAAASAHKPNPPGPVANNDTVNLVTADTSVMSFIIPASQVLANDTDTAQGRTLTVVGAKGISGATVQVTQNGDLLVTPTDPYHPSDTFSYTVSDGHATASADVTVNYTVANSPPVANTSSESVVVNGTSELFIPASDILANVSDPDGDVVSLTGIGIITGGGGSQSDFDPRVSLQPVFDGPTYVAITNATGTPIMAGNDVAFNYVVTDSAGLSAIGNFQVNIT